MSCYVKLKQGHERFTKSEKKVASYILQNFNTIPSLSIQELAARAGSSTGAVMRLIKEIGYDSYTDFKFDIGKDEAAERPLETIIIEKSDNERTITNKLSHIIEDTIKDVIALMDFEKLQETAKRLNKAERIFILGVGGSAIPAADLFYKLIRINKTVVFHQDVHIQRLSAALSCQNDVVIAFSYSGETADIIRAVDIHRRNGTYTVGVMRSSSSPLSKLCNHNCFLPNSEGEIRLGSISSRYAQMFVADLLYLLMTQKDFEKVFTYIRKTKEAMSS